MSSKRDAVPTHVTLACHALTGPEDSPSGFEGVTMSGPVLHKYDHGKGQVGDPVKPKYSLAARTIAKLTRNTPHAVAQNKLYRSAAVGAKFAVSVGAKVLDAHTAGMASPILAGAKLLVAAKGMAQSRNRAKELASMAPNPAYDSLVNKSAGLVAGIA